MEMLDKQKAAEYVTNVYMPKTHTRTQILMTIFRWTPASCLSFC